jgi:hypothetical protein
MVGCGVMAAAALCEAKNEIKWGFAGPCTALLMVASKAGFEFPDSAFDVDLGDDDLADDE